MIDDPVEKPSPSDTKANCALHQITISSASLLMCMAQIAAAERNSSEKSRSLTASMLLAQGRSNPRLFAVMSRSIGNDVPASAAAPRGHSFMRARASRMRPRSRPNIST